METMCREKCFNVPETSYKETGGNWIRKIFVLQTLLGFDKERKKVNLAYS
jgi:hypothetical protein